MIADPLWSCVMLLCGPLRYLVIPSVLRRMAVNNLPRVVMQLHPADYAVYQSAYFSIYCAFCIM